MEVLSAMRQVTLFDALGATMEAHNHNVTLVAQLLDNALHRGCILGPEAVLLMPEGAEAIFHAINLANARLAVLSACHADACVTECLDG